MKDIDFDELDKAVNSLMGGISAKSDKPEPKTLHINPTLKEDEVPEYNNIKQAAERIGSETIVAPEEKTEVLNNVPADLKPTTPVVETPVPVAAPSAVTPPTPVESNKSSVASPKTAGRFMDVMHPSSDMKSSNPVPPKAPVEIKEPEPTPAPVKRTSRVAATIQPLESTKSDAVEKEIESLMVEQQKEKPAAVKSEPVKAPVSPPVISVPISSEQTPLTSPFIADAKVEKRPLGGGTGAVTSQPNEKTEPESENSDEASLDAYDNRYKVDNVNDMQLAPNSSQSEPELPAELHTDLLAIETNFAESEEQAQDTSINETTTKSDDAPSVQSQNGPLTSVEPTKPDNVEGPAEGAIFDVSEYHTPLAHPKKHSFEWLWIVLIVLIVIICAAGAGAFYLLST